MTELQIPSPGSKLVHWGHALDLVDDMPTYDLLVTDPPYAFGGSGGEHALSATVATVLRESGKKLRKGGWAVVFAASSWRSTFYMVEATRGVLDPVRIATWAKPASRSKVRTPGWAWATVNVILFKKPGDKAKGEPSEELDYIEAPEYINEAPLRVGRRAQLPTAVADWAVAPFVIPGGLAFDPFAGSGALLDAAASRGMAAIGFDLDAACVDQNAWLGPVAS